MRLVQVNPGDPHNDQVLALTREDLAHHQDAVKGIMEQGMENNAPMAALLAIVVAGLMDNETETRERLACLLTLSLVKNLSRDMQFDSSSFAKYVNDLAAGR